MSGIKTLFEKQKQGNLAVKTLQEKNAEELFYEAESPEYISEYANSINLYLQDVNFATASNFAKFGSARKYYENIVNRITQYFPFDGSKAEQLEFQNNLNPFEKYIYLYQYPRSTGYVNFSPNGWGVQASSVGGIGLPQTLEYISFYNQNENNIYDPDNGLRENTRFIFSSGSTIEFWMKKNAFADPATQTAAESIFYLRSNNEDKNFSIYLSTNALFSSSIFASYYVSGVSKFTFGYETDLATIADSKWHHYAFTFYSSSLGYTSDFYLDGVFKKSGGTSAGGTFVDFTGSAFGVLGAVGGKFGNSLTPTGSAKLSGSIDEFRFWNTKRDAKQIGLNYFTNIGGGNNKVNNNKIGIYYKFNESISQNSNTDSIVLDYAGRSCNGLFVGYNSYSRSTGSAITDTQEYSEIGTPILYYDHPDVQTFLTESLYYADEYDYQNNFSLKNSMPKWILDEDENNGGNLTNLLQGLSSYLDTLYLQISTYKNIKNKDYLNYKGDPPPFADLLLTSNGFDLPSLFLNTNIIQSILNQDNKKVYEQKINDLKSLIYKNIYNNLEIINKSKGTENSIKQLLKTFGIDQDVFNLNIYANNTNYILEDTYINKSIKKSYVDFTPFFKQKNQQAVIYQSGSNSFITGTNNNSLSFTLESNLIIPQFPRDYDYLSYKTLTFNTASLFGLRTATNNNSEISVSGSDPASLKIRLLYRDDVGYFALNYPNANITLTSSIFTDLLTNQHWNISAKLQPVSTGSSFNLVFSGYCNFAGNQFKQFNVSSSLTTAQGNILLSNNKRVYIGAERNNITGSLQFSSLSKPLSIKYWADTLEDNELKEHAKNPDNYGRLNPYQPFSLATSSYIPKAETLVLHWDFTSITASDSNGNIDTIYDLSSGSSTGNSYSNSPINNLVGKLYNGAGYGFEPSSTVGGLDLVYSSEQQLPENLYSSQLINILSTDDDYYTSAIRPQKYFFSLENSMYDAISKNMLNMFATILEFNNFIGEPTNTYKSQYSKLKFFRKLFFNKVGNTPDLDKYIGIYKWVDDALDSILFNLLPASANASEKIRTIVENHILERSKFQYNIFPDKATKYVGDGNLGVANVNINLPHVDTTIPGLPPKTRQVVNSPDKRIIYTNTSVISAEGTAIENFEKPIVIPTGEENIASTIYKRQKATMAARIGRTR